MNCKISSPGIALLLLTWFAFTTGFLPTYLSSMITTLEKRFEWPTVQIGWLIASSDIGFLLTVMCVAYYGGKGRQALVLSASAFLFFISVIIFVLPFFIWGPKYSVDDIRNTSSLEINSYKNISGNVTTIGIAGVQFEQATVAFAIQFLSGLLNGCAATPFWNVGMSLIDDMSGSNSGLFLGFMFLVRTLSPMLGFGFGGLMVTINEGLVMQANEFAQGLKDVKWIGAWWLGYLLLGAIVLINCPFLALLDVKKLRERGEEQIRKEAANHSKKEVGLTSADSVLGSSILSVDKTAPAAMQLNKISFFEFFVETKKLFTNSVFWGLYLGTLCEIAAFMILLNYFQKYIESHFHVDAKTANWMTSISLSGGTAVSMIASSLISKLFPMTMSQMNGFHASASVVSAIIFPILFAFTCDSVNPIGSQNVKLKLSNYSCIDWSDCSSSQYTPVCVNNDVFMSPCYAGCVTINSTLATNCLCSNFTASFDQCVPECPTVYGYLVVFFIYRVVSSITSVQFTQVVMRLPEKRDFKPLAISCMTLLWGVMGVGTPPLAGKLIDAACHVHNPSNGFCLYYDTDLLRYLVHGTATVFQIPCCLCFVASWWFSRKRYPDHKDPIFIRKRMKAHNAHEMEEMNKSNGNSDRDGNAKRDDESDEDPDSQS